MSGQRLDLLMVRSWDHELGNEKAMGWGLLLESLLVEWVPWLGMWMAPLLVMWTVEAMERLLGQGSDRKWPRVCKHKRIRRRCM